VAHRGRAVDRIAPPADAFDREEPASTRSAMMRRFRVGRMVDEYVVAYTKLLGGRATGPASGGGVACVVVVPAVAVVRRRRRA
jgi:uncharacterized protein (TIGR03382 family)